MWDPLYTDAMAGRGQREQQQQLLRAEAWRESDPPPSTKNSREAAEINIECYITRKQRAGMRKKKTVGGKVFTLDFDWFVGSVKAEESVVPPERHVKSEFSTVGLYPDELLFHGGVKRCKTLETT